ncbi:unnamed protein product [Spirodela intermedia]|uniref:Uncharacterized protein n=1 Tax=Spirodela intermedia TaxID=51605 RepID=A0A7I8K5L2_SPIIN|nr:unnamed protein product [Spirodela intermedia]
MGALTLTRSGVTRIAPYEAYGDYDDYEAEEDDKQEEDPKPTKEVLDFLKLRDQFKEKIRQKYRKENATALGPNHSRDENGKASSNEFGSFFGPSQRVIAPRVIEESRSIRETEHIVSRGPPTTSASGVYSPLRLANTTPSLDRFLSLSLKHTFFVGPQVRRPSSNAEREPLPRGKPYRVINETQRKVQTLKETRDYSFLLSDDADLPSQASGPPKAATAPAPSDRSGQGLPPPKTPVMKPPRQVPERQPSRNRAEPGLGQTRPMPKKVEHQRPAFPARPKVAPSEPRSAPKGGSGGGGGGSHSAARPATVVRKPTSSSAGEMRPSAMERAPLARAPSTSASAQQRREAQDGPRQRALPPPGAAASSSKPQALRAPPRPIQRHGTEGNRRGEREKPSKGHLRNPFDDDDDDIDDPMSFLRNTLLFQSSKYQDEDEDDSDMEANFEDIMKEEKRSSKIAKQEDEEQLRLIEEEEEREAKRREAKRRKLMRR